MLTLPPTHSTRLSASAPIGPLFGLVILAKTIPALLGGTRLLLTDSRADAIALREHRAQTPSLDRTGAALEPPPTVEWIRPRRRQDLGARGERPRLGESWSHRGVVQGFPGAREPRTRVAGAEQGAIGAFGQYSGERRSS